MLAVTINQWKRVKTGGKAARMAKQFRVKVDSNQSEKFIHSLGDSSRLKCKGDERRKKKKKRIDR